jgi:PhnB protein
MAIRPARYRNAIVPHIYIDGAAEAIVFYNKAFGAVELLRIASPNGEILHAEISIGGSVRRNGAPRKPQRPLTKEDRS